MGIGLTLTHLKMIGGLFLVCLLCHIVSDGIHYSDRAVRRRVKRIMGEDGK